MTLTNPTTTTEQESDALLTLLANAEYPVTGPDEAAVDALCAAAEIRTDHRAIVDKLTR